MTRPLHLNIPLGVFQMATVRPQDPSPRSSTKPNLAQCSRMCLADMVSPRQEVSPCECTLQAHPENEGAAVPLNATRDRN